MIHKKTIVKKLLSSTYIAMFAFAPMAFGINAVQADPPRHAPAWGWRDKTKGHDRDRDRDRDKDHHRDRDRRDYRSFTGTVERVNSKSKFELRSGGRTYDVYVSGHLPRRLDKHDVVRVYGYRHGNNDIRNADVTIVRNR